MAAAHRSFVPLKRPGCSWRRAAMLLVVLLAEGCMIGPDFKRPQAPVAAAWLEADHRAVDATRQEYQDWWSVFDDPVLTELIDTAYRQNLSLEAAGVRFPTRRSSARPRR